MASTRLEIQDRGIMLSDYFSGTSGVMLPIYINPETTLKEALEGLKDEINMVWEHIEYTAKHHEFTGDLEKQIDDELERIRNEIKGREDQILCPGMDYDPEEENAVLIFTIEFMEN